jgi:hypothetical protein
MLLCVEKAGRSGGHLKRLYALIPPLPVQRGLKGAGPPANPTGDLDYLVGASSIHGKPVAAMGALMSYAEMFAHPAFVCRSCHLRIRPIVL